jgi:hypothetical protein
MCADARILLKSPSSEYFSDITVWSSPFTTPKTTVVTNSTIEKKHFIVEYEAKKTETIEIF